MEYWTMMPFFGLAVVVYIPGLLGVLCYCTLMAPRYFESRRFRVAIRFLIFKFRADRWWFGIILLLRSFLLGIVTLVFPDNKYFQLLAVFSIILSFLMLHLTILPYQDKYANFLETIELWVLLSITVFGSYFLMPGNFSSGPATFVMHVIFALVVFGMISCCAAFARGYYLSKTADKQAKWKENEARQLLDGFLSVCKIMIGTEQTQLVNILQTCNYLDLWHFDEAYKVMALELCSLQPQSLAGQRLPHSAQNTVFQNRSSMRASLSISSSSVFASDAPKSLPISSSSLSISSSSSPAPTNEDKEALTGPAPPQCDDVTKPDAPSVPTTSVGNTMSDESASFTPRGDEGNRTPLADRSRRWTHESV